MDEGRWVTLKNGRRIFLKTNQSPMDAFIRQKGGTKVEPTKDYNGELIDKQKSEKWVLDETTKEFKKIKEESEAYFQMNNGEKIEQISTKEYNQMKKDFYDKLKEDEKKALALYMSQPGSANEDIDRIFKEKGVTLEKDTLLYRRSFEDYQELKDGYTRKNRYTSTSAYDKIPKTMPSGKSFGDKELYIIAPKGTKVLPLEDVGVKYVAYDDGEKKIFARQHEILLPNNTSMELVQDKTTFEKKGFGETGINEKYVVKLSNQKYNEPEYKIYNYEWKKDYVFKGKDKDYTISAKPKREAGYGKNSRSDFYQYEVFALWYAGENGTFNTFEEAREALKDYLKRR